MSKKFDCPNCDSNNTINVEVLYKEGHSTGSLTSNEIIGYTDIKTTVKIDSNGNKSISQSGGDAVYGNVTRWIDATSDLAREVSPPTMPQLSTLSIGDFITLTVGTGLGCFIPSFLVLLVVIYFFIPFLNEMLSVYNIACIACILSFIMVVFMINSGIEENKHNRQKYDEEMANYKKQLAEWKHYFVCRRCGCIFYVKD